MAREAHPQPASDGELESIIRDLHSPEDVTRAKAVRQVCPCRMGWDGFQRSMQVVATLTKDPSPLVRRAALHVFQDAFEMESGGLPTTPQEITNEMTARKRRMRWRPDEGDEPEPPAPGKKPGPRQRVRSAKAGQRR